MVLLGAGEGRQNLPCDTSALGADITLVLSPLNELLVIGDLTGDSGHM